MAAPDHSPRVAQRRQRILGAAALCFAKDGFARTRIDDVAASAHVSRALVYNHFGSKEELARQVCDHLLDDWSSAVDRALETTTGSGAGGARRKRRSAPKSSAPSREKRSKARHMARELTRRGAGRDEER